jgi:hypothetical protein
MPKIRLILGRVVCALRPDLTLIVFHKSDRSLLRNPAQRAHYAALGRQRAQDYTPERIVPRWEALLHDILTRRSRA